MSFIVTAILLSELLLELLFFSSELLTGSYCGRSLTDGGPFYSIEDSEPGSSGGGRISGASSDVALSIFSSIGISLSLIDLKSLTDHVAKSSLMVS